MQSHFHSFVEANVNTFIGFFLSTTIMHFIVAPMYNLETNAVENVSIVAIFTGVSVIRNYIIRRFHNHLTYRGKMK